MTTQTITARALQLGTRIDLKGLGRPDQFSIHPVAFPTARGGTAVLFRWGVAVFFAMTPIEEDEAIRGLGERVIEPVAEPETETVQIAVEAQADDSVNAAGTLVLRNLAPERLLLVAEALALSVSLASDEKRIAAAFDKIEPIASALQKRRLPAGRRKDLLSQIGEALLLQQRLAGRVDLADRPEVLWDHPELERLWVRLAEEFDLAPRARAISQKLDVIRGTADTLTDLVTTRTSHRLEWYIIVLILIEILLGLYDKVFR